MCVFSHICRLLSLAYFSVEHAKHFRRSMTGDNLLNGVRIISKSSLRGRLPSALQARRPVREAMLSLSTRLTILRTRFLSPSLPRRAPALLYSPTEKSNRVDTRGTVVVSAPIETIPRRHAKCDLNANFVALRETLSNSRLVPRLLITPSFDRVL